jgi:hypothetical protein
MLNLPFYRVILFCVTLLIARLVTLVLSLDEFLGLFRFMGFIVFPEGLFELFNPNGPPVRLHLFGGWLLYVGIAVAATLTKSRGAFVCLYIIFVMLLIANVAGCTATEIFEGPLL